MFNIGSIWGILIVSYIVSEKKIKNISAILIIKI